MCGERLFGPMAFREAEQGRIATAESAVVEASLLPNPVRGTLVDPGDHP